jgi:hypothetical protein
LVAPVHAAPAAPSRTVAKLFTAGADAAATASGVLLALAPGGAGWALGSRAESASCSQCRRRPYLITAAGCRSAKNTRERSSSHPRAYSVANKATGSDSIAVSRHCVSQQQCHAGLFAPTLHSRCRPRVCQCRHRHLREWRCLQPTIPQSAITQTSYCRLVRLLRPGIPSVPRLHSPCQAEEHAIAFWTGDKRQRQQRNRHRH